MQNNQIKLVGLILVCAASSLPGKLVSQALSGPYSGKLEFGLGYTSVDSYKFGEYSGISDKGFFALADIKLSKFADYDSEDNSYWKLSGSSLGLDSRKLSAEYGRQGDFSIFLDYRELPKLNFNDAKSPFSGVGTANQTLPANWVAANSPAGFANLNDSLDTYSLKTERQRFGGGFSWVISKGWEAVGEYRHEYKKGNNTIAGIFATNGGNPRSTILISPVDYDTDTLDFSLAYSGQSAYLTASYFLSVFKNANPSLSWDNPYLRAASGNTWPVGSDFAAGARGQIALPPDNRAQQFMLTGAYKLGKTTRLSGSISHGSMIQNDMFLPYTINSNLAVSASLPRTNLDGRVETLNLKLGITSRPLPKFNVRASYSYDEKDNKTPRDLYQLVLNDTSDQDSLISSGTRLNTPYSFSTERLEFEGGYRLPAASKLSLGYKYEKRERDYSEVASTDEQSAWVKLWSGFSAKINGWLKYTYSNRSGSDYISNQPFLDGHNPDYIDTLAADNRFNNDPLVRKFVYADRDRDEILGSLNIMPALPLTFSLTGRYSNDDYNESELGLQNREAKSITADLAYSKNRLFTVHAFVSREDLKYLQQGYQRTGIALFPGIARVPPLCGTCGFWQLDTDEGSTTLGAGFEHTIIENKLDFKLNYIYSKSVTAISPDADPLVAFAPLPKIYSKLHNFNITGEYQVRENITLRLRYLYESFDLDDLGRDGLEPDTFARVLTLGTGSLDYHAHVVGLSVIYQMR